MSIFHWIPQMLDEQNHKEGATKTSCRFTYFVVQVPCSTFSNCPEYNVAGLLPSIQGPAIRMQIHLSAAHCLLASASQVKPAGTRPLARPPSLLLSLLPSRLHFPVIVLCAALGKGSLYRNLKKVKWPGRKLVLSAQEHY